MTEKKIFILLVGIILAGGGILVLANSFKTMRGNPVRSTVGILVALVLIFLGVVILGKPAFLTGLFR
jgi:uncharacterized membrane protein YidH (DUF202 family)